VADSIRPASIAPASRPKRPLYFVLLLTLVSLLALFGWTNGCETMKLLHDPLPARAAIERIADLQDARMKLSWIEALVANRTRAVPLAAGQFLLGMLLWISTLGILFGRGRMRSVLLQAMVAYGAFLCVSYVVEAPVRAVGLHEIEVTLGGAAPVEGYSQERMAALTRFVLSWLPRGVLATQLAILGAGAFALTRRRVRAWLTPPNARDEREQER
jgi:hypothetical protein